MADLELIRHSLAHVMAYAIQELKGSNNKFAIGPSVSDGFYYDIEFETEFVEADLKKIQEEMQAIIKKDYAFEKSEKNIDEAIQEYKAKKNPYKVEILEDLKKQGETEVTFYTIGDFTDLCRGPHVKSTKELPKKAFKLSKIAGAFWRGDAKNKMLTRVYGLAFETKDELKAHIRRLEEAKKRDHRTLGTELGLFKTDNTLGGGLILWMPKGSRVRVVIEDYWRKLHYQNGYEIVYTPHVGRSNLWETSGHLSHFKENMYPEMKMDNEEYFVKPMNCPFHILIYKAEKHSYKELPIKYAELGTVYRNEKSGVLHGLLRVRGFTQDDAHVICSHEQVNNEILDILKFSIDMWKLFGFEKIKAYVSTKPSKAVGDDAMWNTATNSIIKALDAQGMAYEVDEGGGAFYGPKIDLKIEDAIGREWQMTTIQFDFNLPERFDMTYIDSDGIEKRPYMIHRAIFGSLERFFAVITEHYAGAFPLWLAPIQVRIAGVSDKHVEYVKELEQMLKQHGFRVDIDIRHESVGKKIREGRIARIPYLLLIGDKELEERKNKALTARNRDTGEQKAFVMHEFIDLLKKQEDSKALKLEW